MSLPSGPKTQQGGGVVILGCFDGRLDGSLRRRESPLALAGRTSQSGCIETQNENAEKRYTEPMRC